MATTAFFSVPLFGHVNISLPIISELVRRGERVFYYSIDQFRAQIEQTGAIFCSYGNLDGYFREYNNPITFACDIAKLTPAFVYACLPSVHNQQPAYIMHDTMAYWGSVIAQVLEVPTVASQATFITCVEAIIKSPLLFNKLLDFISRAGKDIEETNKMFAQVTDTFQLPPITFLDSIFLFGDRTFVYSSRQFQPEEQLLGQHVHFIGPSIESRNETTDFPYEQLTDKPLIYIALGTIFNNNPDFFKACLQAFAGVPYQVVMSIGNKVDLAKLGAIPNNFIVRNHVPQIQILSRSALFITHGGLNSVIEAMYTGVPMFVIPPEGGDQPFIAHRVQELGAGQVIDPQRVSVQLLCKTATLILSQPSFAEASAIIGRSFQNAGGSTYAVDEIEKFKKEMGLM